MIDSIYDDGCLLLSGFPLPLSVCSWTHVSGFMSPAFERNLENIIVTSVPKVT